MNNFQRSKFLQKLTVNFSKILITALLLTVIFPLTIKAETPEQWVELGRRVHGGFGSYVAVGIRIGLDARAKLNAAPRELKVTYQDGPFSPCPCVADGIMIATVATPGQNSLTVVPPTVNLNTFGVAIITHKKTGQSLRYTLPRSARALLDNWNKLKEQERYEQVMNAPADSLYSVEEIN